MNSLDHTAHHSVARPKPLAALFRLAGRALHCVAMWSARARQRRELRELDDRLLRDIGLSRDDVELLARKPFWRA